LNAPSHDLERSQIVPRPRHEVFAFFSDVANLQKLTPDFLNFEFLSPLPIAMRAGATVEYRLRLFGVPVRWKTEIELFEPDSRFIDIQSRGPYRSWRHVHQFTDRPGGTRVEDQVAYSLPLGKLGDAVGSSWVRRSLDRIFDYRRDRITELLGGAAPASER
jgi:ligand-binding SRPBCC domain-containing protein